MKITFLGVGSQFSTPDYYHSNMLLTAGSGKTMLIDCGGDVRFSLGESGVAVRDIDAIYVSHLHSDHIGGLEWIALSRFFDRGVQSPKLFVEEDLMHELWNHSLKGGLGCIEGKRMDISDYFDCRPVAEGGAFVWEDLRFSLVKMPHIMCEEKNHYSYGLLIDETDSGGARIFISADTEFHPELLLKLALGVDMVFHDCETSPMRTGVHAHYEDLRTLPPGVREKMWLYHYQPSSRYDPVADGFRGFVKKGQEFDFAANGGRGFSSTQRG
jgi:ribonuclease BN (tRNA processing enzyme)